MAAVIGPVGVHHPHLGEGGVPLLLVLKIGLEEGQVGQIHGQAVLVEQGLQARLIQGGETFQHRHVSGLGILLDQSLRLVQGGLPALHRVDEITLGAGQVVLGQSTGQYIDGGSPDGGPFAAGEHLNTLGAGVGPLVVLARQGLHCQQSALGLRHGFVPQLVHLRLGQDGGAGGLIGPLLHALHVVAADDPHAGEAAEPQGALQLSQQMAGLHVKARLFFHITAKYLPHMYLP